MFDFFFGFFLAFPFSLLLSCLLCYFLLRKNESSIAYDLTIIKEDLANLQVTLSRLSV